MKLNNIQKLIDSAKAERQIATKRYWDCYKLGYSYMADYWNERSEQFDKLIRQLEKKLYEATVCIRVS